MKSFSMTIALLVIWLIGLAAVGCTPNPSVFSAPRPTATITSSQVSGVASATPTNVPAQGLVKGKIVPARFARLSLSTSGILTQVLVKEGDTVKVDDVLAQLDTKDQELQVRAAQDSLDLAKATLVQTKAPASKEEIVAAQAAYDSAVAALNNIQTGSAVEDLKIAKANLEKAQAAVTQAQTAYDRAGGSGNKYIGMLPVSTQLQSATIDYQIAEANYRKAISSNTANVVQAQSTIAQADATLKLKKFGPKPEDIAVAELRVQQAQTSLDQAKATLAKAKLLTPIDGIVTGLALRVGEMIQPGTTVATVVDPSELRVETTELDEFGVSSVKVGQTVRITVDALPDKSLTGKVLYIVSPQLSSGAGDTTYVATIVLDAQDPALRYGMTVRVDFSSP